jgi:formylmethanofuran dehydrogenase subunit E
MGKEELVADNTFYSLFAKKDARIELKKILLHFYSHIPPKVQEEFKKLKKEDFWNEIKPCLNLIENPDKMNFTDLLRPFISEEEIKELPKEEIKEKNWDTRICVYCQMEIGTEKKRYANGKLFHKKCFKKAQSNYINGKPINAQ